MHLGTLIHNLVQFHNVRMPQVGQRIDLAVDGLLGLTILEVLFVVRLDRDHVLRLFVGGSPHDGEGALSNLEADLELFHV